MCAKKEVKKMYEKLKFPDEFIREKGNEIRAGFAREVVRKTQNIEKGEKNLQLILKDFFDDNLLSEYEKLLDSTNFEMSEYTGMLAFYYWKWKSQKVEKEIIDKLVMSIQNVLGEGNKRADSGSIYYEWFNETDQSERIVYVCTDPELVNCTLEGITQKVHIDAHDEEKVTYKIKCNGELKE